MSKHKLSYAASNPTVPRPPPKDTTRTFLPTPSGNLELLYSSPTHPSALPPILFQHGGFGSANCYKNYLPYFSSHGYPSYSLSLRGHGNSWYPSYWRMYFTSKETFSTDLIAAIEYITATHGRRPILVGHSAGGGLSQITVDRGIKVHALGLIGAFPNYGGLLVYCNWFLRLDKWCFLRMFWDLFHPRSPLKFTHLVHNAFFSKEFPMAEVMEFEKDMPEYESMNWPSRMFFRIADVEKVKRNTETGKVFVMAGREDTLMTPNLMERMAKEYGVPFVMVEGGHNVMRDLYWEKSAEKLLDWIQNLEK
jgi:pimeloyl-ACP methyl ester carboxylesterase